jgi:hypothetical protein
LFRRGNNTSKEGIKGLKFVHCYSGSEGDGTDEVEALEEGDGELQIITECWIEPQHGLVVNCPPERDYMELLPYYKLADVVSTCHV